MACSGWNLSRSHVAEVIARIKCTTCILGVSHNVKNKECGGVVGPETAVATEMKRQTHSGFGHPEFKGIQGIYRQTSETGDGLAQTLGVALNFPTLVL